MVVRRPVSWLAALAGLTSKENTRRPPTMLRLVLTMIPVPTMIPGLQSLGHAAGGRDLAVVHEGAQLLQMDQDQAATHRRHRAQTAHFAPADGQHATPKGGVRHGDPEEWDWAAARGAPRLRA